MNTLETLYELAREHAGTGAIAAFDWDDTCISGDLGVTALAYADQADGGDRLARYLDLDAKHGHAVSYPFSTTVFAGFTRDELHALGERAFDAAIQTGVLGERPWVRPLMDTLRENGWQVWVITASTAACIEPIAARYGVPRERLIGMELLPNLDGHLTDVLALPAPYGVHKPAAFLERAGRAPTLALSDSPSDIALLEMAKHPVAVGASPQLAEHARAKGWLHLERP